MITDNQARKLMKYLQGKRTLGVAATKSGMDEKTAMSIRIDNDILEFFRKQGKGYQSKINAVLRSYKEHA